MKKMLLTGIAALFLATGTAHAQQWPVTNEIENLIATITYFMTCGNSSTDPKCAEWYTNRLKQLNDLASNYPEDKRLAADQKIRGFIQQVTQNRFCGIAYERIWNQKGAAHAADDTLDIDGSKYWQEKDKQAEERYREWSASERTWPTSRRPTRNGGIGIKNGRKAIAGGS